MRTRAPGKPQTKRWISANKIIGACVQYPLLHAYGIGFEDFRSIPEDRRALAVDYAKYMLAYELDDEIDSATIFLKAVGIRQNAPDDCYIRSAYVEYMYQYWRLGTYDIDRQFSKHPKVMPRGVFAIAALLLGGRVKIVEKLKPHYLLPLHKDRRVRLEKYLEHTTKFKRWSLEEMTWNFDDD